MKIFKKILIVFILLQVGNIAFAEDIYIYHTDFAMWKIVPKVDNQNEVFFATKDVVKVKVFITADETGAISSAEIKESNGTPQLNKYVLESVKKASFKPYQENGVYLPLRVVQPFEFHPYLTIWDKAFWQRLFK